MVYSAIVLRPTSTSMWRQRDASRLSAKRGLLRRSSGALGGPMSGGNGGQTPIEVSV
jgi:hypothetical protein